ncbi:MAG: GNAT family N-acetyltransferase [Bacteroidota bacterium]
MQYEKPLRITLARKKTELRQIIALQKANLRITISEETAREQGFVTAVHTMESLQKLNDGAAAAIAKIGSRVVGYALAMKREFAADVPSLTFLFAEQDEVIYRGKRFGDASYLVMGQVCVAAEASGQKIVDRMYRYLRGCYALHYDYLQTAIDARNTRSLRVHERIGFEVMHRFSDEQGRDWVLVTWPWND